MIATVTLNPAVDKTVVLPGFSINEVNRVSEIRLDPGGKGINVAKVLRMLGEETCAYGIVGGGTGKMIESRLDAMGISHNFSHSPEETRINLKIADPLLGTFTDINEPGCPVTSDLLTDVWTRLTDTLHKGDVVVLAGKNPPGMDPDLLRQWTEELRRKGILVAADTVGEAMKKLVSAKPDIIKPNCEELRELMGEDLPTERDLKDAVWKLTEAGAGLVALSMGKDGAILCDGRQMIRSVAPSVPVSSTVGAGDAMMAALVSGRVRKKSLEELARESVAVSAAKVTCPGSAPPDWKQISSLMDRVVIREER